MERTHGDYLLSDDLTRVDFGCVHSMLTKSYWSPGVAIERVRKAASKSSLVVGAYSRDGQVGYCRVVSDQTTFAWVCDVIVLLEHQSKGLGRAMVRFAMDHPEHQGMRRWLLATRDAHGVYEPLGYHLLEAPERWMICRGPGAPPDPIGPG